MTDVEIVRCAGADHGPLQGGSTLLSNGFSERLHFSRGRIAAAASTENARCAETARLSAHSPYPVRSTDCLPVHAVISGRDFRPGRRRARSWIRRTLRGHLGRQHADPDHRCPLDTIPRIIEKNRKLRWTLEVVAVSVSDVDRAKASPSASSSLPSTTARINDGMRFVQLTSQANDDLEFTLPCKHHGAAPLLITQP